MKLSPDICRARVKGFTLPEILVAMAIFTLLIAAVCAVQLFAVRIYQFAATKLTATSDGRRTVNFIREQVREAKLIYIGSFTNSGSSSATFSAVGDGTNEVGGALLIFPTTNTTYGTIFYEDAVNSNLCSAFITNATTSTNGLAITGTLNTFRTNAPFVTNYYVFQAEDYQGNILQNNNNNRIIHVILQFSQLEYPVAGIGKGAMYDYYELHTRATRRTID
jgi:prepilin-type N-terminal cleavage/methylation domain-containing protein